MLIELHCHTTRYSSCSLLEPVEAIRRVLLKGLQGLVLTEHHHLWDPAELEHLKLEAEVDPDFLLLAGQEVDTDLGHVLVFGADQSIVDKLPVAELRHRFPQAALVLAHPFRHQRTPRDQQLLHPVLDGVEIFNSNHTAKSNYCALATWHRLKFTATGGSDAHARETVGLFPTQFDHPLDAIEALVVEIRYGRCRPFFKEIPKSGSNVRVTEVTIGTKGDDEFRQRFVVKSFPDVRRWRRQRSSLNTIRRLLDNGFYAGRFRVPRLIEVNEQSRLLIEEGQRGKTLFDLLLHVSSPVAQEYLELTAHWLARMHALKLRVSGVSAAVSREQRRYKSYFKAFVTSASPYLQSARELLLFVEKIESKLFTHQVPHFCQNHGDFHPKNIIIGQDRAQDVSTLFVSVIDFANAIYLLPTFDLGYFLAQCDYQFSGYPAVIRTFDRQRFLENYLQQSGPQAEDFQQQIAFFELRGILSIAAYLIKVGKGESADMQQLIARCLTLKSQLESQWPLAAAGTPD